MTMTVMMYIILQNKKSYVLVRFKCLKCYYVQCFKCVARLYFYSAFLFYNLDFILLWNIFNAICFMCFIFVNSVIVSSIVSCNDLYQDFIIMYVYYFVSRNSTSVQGAIWPSLSPCTVINPILLTYLLVRFKNCCKYVCWVGSRFHQLP